MKRSLLIAIMAVICILPGSLAADDNTAAFKVGCFDVVTGVNLSFGMNITDTSGMWKGTVNHVFIEAQFGLFSRGSVVVTPRISAGYGLDYFWLDEANYLPGTVMSAHGLVGEAAVLIGNPSGWFFGAGAVFDFSLGGYIESPDEKVQFDHTNLGLLFGMSFEAGYSVHIGSQSFIPVSIRTTVHLGIDDTIPMDFGLVVGYKHRLGKK